MTLSYSDEDIVEIMVDIPDDDLESEEHKLEVLQEVKDEIAETGGVNYDLAITLETLMEGCISKQMPLRSFTKQHSLTNYNVAIEGIDKVTKYVKENILDKVVEAIKKLIQWLASLFARSGSSSDKPQKEKIAESVKSATRNDTRQKNETKREQDIAKRISRVDALSKTLVESIQKDMEGNAEFNSSGSDVEKTFMDIRKFYATIGLRGKFSPFIYQLTVKHDGSDLANATKLMTLLTEHISLVFIEIGALSKAIDNNQEFPPRQGFMPYERYNTVLKSFKNVNFNEAENKGLPTVTEFKKGLYEYIKLDETIKVDSFDDVTWHGAASYFEGASQRMGEKFIEQVLHVNNIITKIQTKLKAEKDDATVGLYLPAVEMIKDEIAYITHVSSIIDLLEVACGNFANAYNKKVIDASRYFVQLFNNRVKKMEGLDNETKDKILEYVNAKDDKTASLESILDQTAIATKFSYLYSIDEGMSNAGIGLEGGAIDGVKRVAAKVAEMITNLVKKLKEWLSNIWNKISGKNSDASKTVESVKKAQEATEKKYTPQNKQKMEEAVKRAEDIRKMKEELVEIRAEREKSSAKINTAVDEMRTKLDIPETATPAEVVELAVDEFSIFASRSWDSQAWNILVSGSNDRLVDRMFKTADSLTPIIAGIRKFIDKDIANIIKEKQAFDKDAANIYVVNIRNILHKVFQLADVGKLNNGNADPTLIIDMTSELYHTTDLATAFSTFNELCDYIEEMLTLPPRLQVDMSQSTHQAVLTVAQTKEHAALARERVPHAEDVLKKLSVINQNDVSDLTPMLENLVKKVKDDGVDKDVLALIKSVQGILTAIIALYTRLGSMGKQCETFFTGLLAAIKVRESTAGKVLELVQETEVSADTALESLLVDIEYGYYRELSEIRNLGMENFLDKVTDALMNFLSNTFTKLYDILKGKLTDQELAVKTGKKNAALLEKNTKDLLRIGKIYEHRDTQREVVNAVKSLSSGKNASNVLLGAILKPEDTIYIHLFEEKFAKQQDILFTPHLALDSDFNFTTVLKTVVKTDGATAQNRSFINDMLAKSKKELTTKLILFTAYHDDGSKYDHRDLDDETNLLKAIKENMNFLLAPADEYYRIPDTDVLVGFIHHVTDIYKYLDVHVGNMKGALTNIQKWEGMLNTIPESTKVPKDTMDGIKDFVYTYAIMVKTSIFIVDSLLKTVNGIVEALLTNSNKVIEACKDL